LKETISQNTDKAREIPFSSSLHITSIFKQAQLTAKEWGAIRLRHLSDEGKMPTFRELGRSLGLAGTGAKRSHSSALNKLRFAAEKIRLCGEAIMEQPEEFAAPVAELAPQPAYAMN